MGGGDGHGKATSIGPAEPGARKKDWSVAEGGKTPVRQVAARTIRRRLDAVWVEARAVITSGSAAGGSSQDRVHRLRVATRRTLAAIDAFADLVPLRQRMWFRKKLRRLRRAAGDARDLDVLTMRLAGAPAKNGRSSAAASARGRLIAMLARQQDGSRQPIRDVVERLMVADWTGRVDRLVARVAESGRKTSFERYARRHLKPFVLRFFGEADRRLRSAEELHDLRIHGKKLRYALEIFAGVLEPDVRERCEASLERLQETLGEFTDHAAAADRFRRWSHEVSMTADRSTLRMLRRQETALADAARRRFARWWNPSRRRELRQTFERSLRRHPA
jgi:CHAD domain-containing protein